jgi:lipopolysaccharide transport system permease protein
MNQDRSAAPAALGDLAPASGTGASRTGASGTGASGTGAVAIAVPEPEMFHLSELTYRARWRHAVADLTEALRLSDLSRTLGWLDIKIKYRGSVLGPFWLTLSTAVLVGTLGVLYSELFHIKLHDFLPFIALSLVLWNFLSMLVSDACVAFTLSEATIRSVRMPFFVFAGQNVYRNLLILAHNLVVIVVVFIVFRIVPGLPALMAIPSLLLWLADAFAITILLGAFCARFRDVPPIVASVLQIAFYISPIIWKPELLPAKQRYLLTFDPFYSLFEIVRAPLLGFVPEIHIWVSAIGYSAGLCLLAWIGFVRVRSRIAFWI